MKKEHPTVKHAQLKHWIFKEFQASPLNPMNKQLDL